jgi:aryl-alcohol dehydrogenase-like predicted oxidoreductase
MILRRLGAVVVVVAFSVMLELCSAFSLTTPLSASRSGTSRKPLHMSDDDELSKLISKRNQIKRNKKKEDIMDAIEDKLAAAMEPVVDLDLDKLPEFKTERIARRKETDETAEEDSSKKKEADAPIVDYFADYEDENDWHIPNRIGITSVAWGDTAKNFVPTGKLTKRLQKAGKFVAGDVQLAVTKLLEGGITLIETSPSYGAASRSDKISAEDILKQCLKDQDSSLPEAVIMENLGTGAAAWKALLRPGATMVSVLEDSLGRLGSQSSVDIFMAPKLLGVPTRVVAAGLAAQIESGQANYVGVTGITSAAALKRLCKHLEARDCLLTANAFSFSLTNPRNEDMIFACKEAGVVPIITDPLDGGLASGVFTATNPSGGMAGVAKGKFSFKELEKLQPLHSVQETIAERVRTRVMRGMRDTQERFKSKFGPPPKINTDITTTQVALNWVIAKGGVPLAEVNNPSQADEVLGCLGWKLTDDEVNMLDAAVALCKL